MTTPQASLSLRTGQLLHPASHPASRRRTGASLPGTLASPRTGLPPAGCPELVERLRHDDLLVIAAPALLGAPERSVRRPASLASVWPARKGAMIGPNGRSCPITAGGQAAPAHGRPAVVETDKMPSSLAIAF